MFDLTAPYYLILNTFEYVWNWLNNHYIVIDEYRASFLGLIFLYMFFRFLAWVFPFMGDPFDDDNDDD